MKEQRLAESFRVGRRTRDWRAAERMILVPQNNDAGIGEPAIDALTRRNLDLGQKAIEAADLENWLATFHRLPWLSDDVEDLTAPGEPQWNRAGRPGRCLQGFRDQTGLVRRCREPRLAFLEPRRRFFD